MGQQLKVILDTSVYGKVVTEEKIKEFTELVGRKKAELTVYGTTIIRKELRDTPKDKVIGTKKLRMLLLNLYDALVKNHRIMIGEVMEDLVQYYLIEYKGHTSKEKIRNDFLIVASATIKGLDIVVSEDNKTMLSKHSMRAYERVNKRNDLRTPEFHSLKEFEQEYLK